MKRNVWTLAIAGVLVAILLLYTVAFIVPARQVAVVKTLGSIEKGGVYGEPGLYGKAPWPFQSVELKDMRLRLMDVPGKELQTQDKFNIIPAIAVGWRITDAERFVTRFDSDAHAEEFLLARVGDARERGVKAIKLNDIITTAAGQEAQYTAFEESIRTMLQRKLDDADYGIRVDFLRVTGIAFPESVTKEVFSRMEAERKQVSEAYVAAGENEARQIKDNAELEKNKILADARGEATEIRGQGDAEAAGYYAVMQQNKELANYLRQCDALRESLKEKATVVLTTEGVVFNLLQKEPPKVPVTPMAPRKGEN